MYKLPSNVEKILDDAVNGIITILGDRVKKIILYGSYARGDYRKNSDVDIMILTDCNVEEIEDFRDKISDFVYDIELETGYVISPIIKNIDKFKARVDVIPFYKNVEKEGVVLLNGQ